MTRHSHPFLSLVRFGCPVLLALSFGCGGPSAVGAETETGGTGANAGLPKDAQAEAAQTFCAHDIKAAELQPPDALTRKQIMACITAIRPQLKAQCAKSAPRDIVLKIVIEKTGKVLEAFAIGDGADSPEATCAAGLVKAVQFPQFKGAPQQVIQKYPMSVGK
jgi:hypothetical protein